MTQRKQLDVLKYDNHEAADEYVVYDNSRSYTTSDISSSSDPFSGKTNKYAESAGVIITSGTAFHFIWSSAGTAATTSHMLWPAGVPLRCAVDPDNPYLRVIAASGTPALSVSEVGEYTV